MVLMLCNVGWMCDGGFLIVNVVVRKDIMISGRRTVSVDTDE